MFEVFHYIIPVFIAAVLVAILITINTGMPGPAIPLRNRENIFHRQRRAEAQLQPYGRNDFRHTG
ncbi:hypothetical protein [Leclercia sp. LSNIH1]|jgi:hypothetical protein|uniref:hypothetical protein n=1 Tax=Leclercia sp. LSNIH1 TaxID=1920114 RepID=UPI0011132C63|nr:hypothetical protein [Leclercia sp. LSNIH1]